MMIFDAHLDLAMNAMEWNRDLRLPIAEIRARESHLTDKSDRGNGTVCFPELRRAEVGLCMATQIARYVKPPNRRSGWNSPEQTWAQTQGQLAWYREMEAQGELVQVTDWPGLQAQLELWNSPASSNTDTRPIGCILTLEGADSIVTLAHLERAFASGLRAIGPAHYGPGTYAQGTDATGGLGSRGRDLLREMERLGIILDVTHLCDESFWEALDCFQGPVWASHTNCRALAPGPRQFSDDQIKALVERGAVIGGVLEASMLMPHWVKGTSPAEAGCRLEKLLDHYDHICQIAGNAHHCGLGSDLDGGFGREQSPADIDTIADLQKLPDLLYARGYTEEDVRKIMHKNFVQFLLNAWK